MFGIKKKGREQSARLHKFVAQSLAPHIVRLSQKMRYPARRRVMNMWGARNRGKVAFMYGGFVVVILAFNIVGLLNTGSDSKQNDDPLRLAEINAGNPFDGMAVVNSNRESIRSSVSELARANLALASRLDSLCGLEVKSRRDSIEIVSIYKKLNNIKDNLNEPKTD